MKKPPLTVLTLLVALTACGDITVPGQTTVESDLFPAPVRIIEGYTYITTNELTLAGEYFATPSSAVFSQPMSEEDTVKPFRISLPDVDAGSVPRFKQEISDADCTSKLRGGVYARLIFVNTLMGGGKTYSSTLAYPGKDPIAPPAGVELQNAMYIYSDRDTVIKGEVNCDDGFIEQQRKLDLNLKTGWNRATALYYQGGATISIYSDYANPYVDFWIPIN